VGLAAWRAARRLGWHSRSRGSERWPRSSRPRSIPQLSESEAAALCRPIPEGMSARNRLGRPRPSAAGGQRPERNAETITRVSRDLRQAHVLAELPTGNFGNRLGSRRTLATAGLLSAVGQYRCHAPTEGTSRLPAVHARRAGQRWSRPAAWCKCSSPWSGQRAVADHAVSRAGAATSFGACSALWASRTAAMTRVAVTGRSGFLAGWCITQLLDQGHEVVATIRSPQRETGVRAAVGAKASRSPQGRMIGFTGSSVRA
jgi:hypothetical protein